MQKFIVKTIIHQAFSLSKGIRDFYTKLGYQIKKNFNQPMTKLIKKKKTVRATLITNK